MRPIRRNRANDGEETLCRVRLKLCRHSPRSSGVVSVRSGAVSHVSRPSCGRPQALWPHHARIRLPQAARWHHRTPPQSPASLGELRSIKASNRSPKQFQLVGTALVRAMCPFFDAEPQATCSPTATAEPPSVETVGGEAAATLLTSAGPIALMAKI